MTVARVDLVKGRKPWVCNKCRRDIPKGEQHRAWSVGFRGSTQRRCMDCPSPPTSELESSAVAAVYSAIEGVDFSEAGSMDDLESMMDDIKAAVSEVADEYENNEVYEMNYDLQERAETLRNAESELESWADSLDSPPEEEEGEDNDDDDPEGPFQVWLDTAKEAAQDAVNNMELP